MIKSRFAIILIALGLSISLFQSCVTVKPPQDNVAVSNPGVPPASQIEIPFDISLQKVFTNVETQIPKSLGAAVYTEQFGSGGPDEPSCGFDCGYDISRSPLTFQTTSNSVTTSFSVAYWLKCRKRIPCPGPLLKFSCGVFPPEPPRRAHGSLTTALKIYPNWTADVQTRNNGVSPIDRCKFGFGGLKDMTDIVVSGFNNAFNKAASALDSKINENLQLRSRVEILWSQLKTPIRIDENSWIIINPEKLKLTELDLSNFRLKFKVGLIAKPAIEIGSQPTPNQSAMPDAELSPVGNTFVLFVPISATQEFIENRLKKTMKIDEGGIKYPIIGKKYIKITDVNFYGYGSKVVLRLPFKGSAKGWAYFIATPTFNAATNVLSFPDLDYMVETRNIILKTIDWMNHNDFISDLKNRLTIDLTSQINDSKAKIIAAINKQYGDVKLNGDVNDLSLVSINTEPDNGKVTARFNMTGHLNASIK